jgi:hypothetical protein
MFRKIALILVMFSYQSLGASHEHHAQHNMVVYGTDVVYASHIVYKKPHNYQVILNVDLPGDVGHAYREARQSHPGDMYIFLLDPSNIADIEQADFISGALFRRDSDGQRADIASHVVLNRTSFRIVFFQELPLSLSRGN